MIGRSSLMTKNCSVSILLSPVLAILGLLSGAANSPAQERREREPNAVYAQRREKLAVQLDSPVILRGFTGREESAQVYVFAQEENFYYLTGQNEEGAAVVLLPAKKTPAGSKDVWDGPREILFLPEKDPRKEKWNGVRLSPKDPSILQTTGFASVKSSPELQETIEKLSKVYPEMYTILPYQKENGGYPHEKETLELLQRTAPQTKWKDVRNLIASFRLIKSPTELVLLQKAIDLSLDAHLAAMKMMHPGLMEYEIAAKMVEVHAMGGSENEAYHPIVGAGKNSTALHYDYLSRKIQEGDIVVLDVAAQYSGYAADITRTLPANGKFTTRQREIYDIVLGAQNAALAALKPGVDFCKAEQSVSRIARDYINSHGKDLNGRPLGQYFIHGLGHPIGLNVHDVGDFCAPLQPGTVITVEPGIYIPEESLGVRIEDDVLITETGYKLLSERLPRDPDEIEKIMAAADAQPSKKVNEADPNEKEIELLIAKYAISIDRADTDLAAKIWWDSPQVSFVHPLGHERGFDQSKQNIYKLLTVGTFSERKLSVRDVSVQVPGDSALPVFYWDFAAKFRKGETPIATHGRETQLYVKQEGVWRLAHVHYSGMPVSDQRQNF
jgi:Xaa-Pro aminopeptidase